VTEVDYTEMRFERRERIVRDLRTRRRNSRYKRRLPCVRKAYQTNVGEQLELELEIQRFASTSALMIARSTIGRSREMRVSKTAATSTRRQPTIAIMIQVMKQVACISIKDLCSNRNSNHRVLAVASGPV